MVDLLAVGTRRSIQVYDFKELNLLAECLLSSSSDSICASEDMIISGGDSGSLSVLNAKDINLIQIPDSVHVSARQRTGSPVECVAVAPKRGVILSGHLNGALHTWDSESGMLLHRLTNIRLRGITCIDVSDDEEIAASASWDGSIQVWDTASWKVQFGLEESEPIVYVSITSDNRRIVSCTRTGWVRVWDGATRSPGFCLFSSDGGLNVELTVSTNGENLICDGGRGTCCWTNCAERTDI